MPAPSSSPRACRLLPVIVLFLFAALVAAGCTVPGSSRLKRPPRELPPSLQHVTADVLAFTLLDTDPESPLWAGARDQAEPALAQLHSALTGGFDADLDDIEPWIGRAAGVALRELDLDGDTETSTLYYADVRSRAKLEAFLEDEGWTDEGEALSDNDLQLWTRAHGCDPTPDGTTPICAAPEYVEYRAVAVGDRGVYAARTSGALRSLLRSAAEYAVPDRKAMREYAVEASKRVPAAAVFRFDLLRTQLRRPFEHDPALLELARWATDSNTLVALRDGWIGIAPPLRGRTGIRVVGASEWVPDLAPDIELQPASRAMLDELGPGLDWAVALRDPGQQLRELVRAITVGAGQYATGQDVTEKETVELLPVLDQLDGDAAIGGSGSYLEAFVEGGDANDVRRVIEHAGLDGTVEADEGAVRIEIGSRASTAGSRVAARFYSFDAAGKPPRPPVAWFWTAGASCAGPAAGWITFDGTDELRLSIAVQAGRRCPAGLLTRTLVSIGVPSSVASE